MDKCSSHSKRFVHPPFHVLPTWDYIGPEQDATTPKSEPPTVFSTWYGPEWKLDQFFSSDIFLMQYD